MIKSFVIPITPFQQNCTLLRCESTGQGVVIDVGGETGRIIEAIEAAEIELQEILLTHGHVDHAAGATQLARELGVPITGPHEEDRFWLDDLPDRARAYGLPPAEVVTPDRWLVGGDTVRFGESELEVLHCPGHTPGHVVFYSVEDRLAQVGDVIFWGSIGRTDFPRGDYDTLIRSIQEQLLPLGDDVTFICGHGPNSTFGTERQQNPFLLDPDRFRGMV